MLVIDTALGACSAALFDGQVLASRFQTMERGHAQVLPLMVEEVLAEAGLSPKNLKRIAVTQGPGTFTGQRIGLSFAIGIALALAIPIVGIDTLRATAVGQLGQARPILVAHQAGATGKFYVGMFDGQSAERLTDLALLSMAELGPYIKNANPLLVGTGANLIAQTFNKLEVAKANHLPDAKCFAAFANGLPSSNALPQPIYLREPDAKPSAPAHVATAKLRPSLMQDLPAMARIHAECFAEGWSELALQSTLSNAGAGAVLIELAGMIYGFAIYQWVAGEAEILTICVRPNYRRQHFGARLLTHLVKQLRDLPTAKLFLEVAADNPGAIALYENHGFTRVGARIGYYARPGAMPVDAILMTLNF